MKRKYYIVDLSLNVVIQQRVLVYVSYSPIHKMLES